MRPIVYTTIFGNYDSPKSHPDMDADFICLTDNPDLKSDYWEMEYHPEFEHHHPRIAAKYFKLLCPYDGVSLFIDGNIEIVSPNILEELGAFMKNGFAMYQHPSGRDCIKSEVRESLLLEKYKDLPIKEQVDYYFSQGMPERFGLWACGLIMRDGKHSDFGSKWMLENTLWTYQDQLSLPYVVWKEKFKLDTITLNQYACFDGGDKLFNIRDHNHNG